MTAAPRSRRALGIPALALAALLVAALLPRLWRFEAVGEGTDEAYSVMATRAMREGRFSYSNLNDFTADGYQAKFTPVAEAVAVPFVAVLGDRPLAYRLPSLLATLATLALLAAWLGRRHGPWAVAGLAALSLLDYRSLVYAQTHRYVAIEQLLLVGAFLAAVRAERTRRLGPALLFGALCLLAFHAHFFALLVVVPLCGMLAREAWRTRRGPRRFPAATIVVVALLALESVVVLLLFRSRASAGLFGSAPLGEVVPRAALSTLRMAGGLGIVAALVGFPVAFLLLRRGRFPERACAVVVLGGLVLFAVGCLRWDLRPRYGLCLQPFLWLAAALPFARAFERWKAAGQRTRELGNFAASRPWGQSAMLALAAAVTALPGLAYLAGGGGRDTEAKAIEILRRHARPGDGVLYDTGFQDPFRRRPSEFPAFPKERARAAGGEAALDSAGVRWVIRSSLEPASVLYSPQFESRLRGPGEELGKVFVVPVFPFQSYYVISVSRIAPP